MIAPDWLASNSYRVLGLPADAGPQQIQTAAASLRKAALLGVEKQCASDLSQLGIVKRTEGDIRAAVGRLNNPTQRLIDRLFWLHSYSFDTPPAEPTARSASLRNHDAALHSLFAAITAHPGEAAFACWATAIRAWQKALSDEDYWDRIQGIELKGDFEPAALPSEIDGLRFRATTIAAEPLLRLGREAMVSRDVATAGGVTGCLNGLSDTGPWAYAAIDELVEPEVSDFLGLCRRANEKMNGAITRQPNAAPQNVEPCAAGLKGYLSEIRPALDRLLGFVPTGHEARTRARETAAQTLACIASATTWTDDFVEAERLLVEALALAEGTLAALKIEQDLQNVTENARLQRLEAWPTARAKSAGGGSNQGSDEQAAEAVLAPFLTQCQSLLDDLHSKLRRDNDAIAANVAPCKAALQRYRAEINPALEAFLFASPYEGYLQVRARECAARCLAEIASATTWTDGFVEAERLYRTALELARDTSSAPRIQKALERISEAAHRQRLRGQPLKSAPPLGTFNGIGSMLYGHSDPDPETGSYVTTRFFVIFGVPIFPVGRYRVISHPGRRYQFLGKQPFRSVERWWLGTALTVFSAILLVTVGSSIRSNSYVATDPYAFVSSGGAADASNAGADASAAADEATNAAADAGAAADGSNAAADASAAANAATNAPQSTGSPAWARGTPTFGAQAVNSDLMARIDAGRARITDLDSQIADLKNQIDVMSSDMDTLKSGIDQMESQNRSGLDVDRSAYDAKLEQYNEMVPQIQSLTSRFNSLVEEHNSLLADDHAMVTQYNVGQR